MEQEKIKKVFEEAGLKNYSLKGLVDRVINFTPNKGDIGVMACKVIGATFDEAKEMLYLAIHPVVIADSPGYVRGEVLGYTKGTGWYITTYERATTKKPDIICGQAFLDY